MSKNTYAVQQLITKMKDPDSDLKFMALTDLISDMTKAGDSFGVEDATAHALVAQVLDLLHDQNSEVKNLAVKALAALVKKVSQSRVQTMIDRLVTLSSSTDEGVRDISSLGLKAVVSSISPATALATTVCSKLAPQVVALLDNPLTSADLAIDSLDLLADILTRFESTVRPLTKLQSSVLSAGTRLLSHSRTAVCRRSVGMLATLVACSEKAIFTKLMTHTISPALESGQVQAVKTTILLVGSLARQAPARMGRKAAALVPIILASASDEDDEVKELVLQTLEALILNCSSQVSPLVTQIVQAATTCLAYDPNYAGDDDDDNDEDVDMEQADDEATEEDDFGDEYSDDDDTSWKVRRAATKLLAACISTRPDLLATFYRTLSPALVARFGDREETVQVQVWATFTALLAQTRAQTSASSARASSPSSLKRKRSTDEMVVEQGPIALLQAQASAVISAILRHLATKSLPTRQAGFALLHELVTVLGRSLQGHLPLVITRIEAALSVSDGGLSGAAAALKLQVLSLLGLLLATHPVAVWGPELARLGPLLVTAVDDAFHKIAAEALVTCTALVQALRAGGEPLGPAAPVVPLEPIYAATLRKLSSSTADEEVKEKGLVCLGALLYHAGDELAAHMPAALAHLRARLDNEASRLVAVQVVGRVAASPVCSGPSFAPWVLDCLGAVALVLRKVSRPLKVAAFGSLTALLARAGSPLPPATADAVVDQVRPLLTDADVTLLPLALDTMATLLAQDATLAPRLTGPVLPAILLLVRSPLVQGPSLEGLLNWFAAYVAAGAAPAALVQQLAQGAGQSGKPLEASGVSSGLAALVTTSRCIGVITRAAPTSAEAVIAEFQVKLTAAKPAAGPLILGLLTLGEIGRLADLSSYPKIFPATLGYFASASEDVRRCAAFAAGNLAVGGPETYLAALLELIEADDKRRYLALQALKEVILHSPAARLAAASEMLWTRLFSTCEDQEEGTRNMAADCLGQLTIADPAHHLPLLQAKLTATSAPTRGIVMAALRFTLTHESASYDELLAPLLPAFFRLIHDSHLSVRRLALSTLNSAAHNKPHLVREHLGSLLPELYGQTEIDESLIRLVEMGPFKHKVDDGLDIRKTAYECMHTLLDTCLAEIQLEDYLARVLGGLDDEDEVKKLCYLMLVKLAHIAPHAVTLRLDDCVPAFTATLETTLKESAVKQETERLAELQKAALRCLAVLSRLGSPAASPTFSTSLMSLVTGSKWGTTYKQVSATTVHSLANVEGSDAMQLD